MSQDGPDPVSRRRPGRPLSRREALRLGAGTLATAALAPSLLTACGGTDGNEAPASAAGGVASPASDGSTTAGLDLILKRIPSSGEQIPVIGMGTWQTFMVEETEEELEPLRQVLRIFHERGGRVVDSSPMYDPAEELLGRLAEEAGLMDDFWVATKVWTEGREEGIAQMEQSLSELRRTNIELMQVHNLVDVDVQLDTLEEWKAQGRFRYIGVSNTSAQRYPEVEALLDDGRLDFVQINYSIAERESGERILPMARERDIGIITARPFAGGQLFQAVEGESVPEWASEFDCDSWAQFFLKYIASHPAVTCAIPATSNPDHMRDNMGAGVGRLPDEATRRRMEEVFDAL
ncbi:MAG: aldo/keto reductase [Gemmatimonadales bacterium]|nr:MAG: aldo/keto reductase [Gemmatimonadales bacterium]